MTTCPLGRIYPYRAAKQQAPKGQSCQEYRYDLFEEGEVDASVPLLFFEPRMGDERMLVTVFEDEIAARMQDIL